MNSYTVLYLEWFQKGANYSAQKQAGNPGLPSEVPGYNIGERDFAMVGHPSYGLGPSHRDLYSGEISPFPYRGMGSYNNRFPSDVPAFYGFSPEVYKKFRESEFAGGSNNVPPKTFRVPGLSVHQPQTTVGTPWGYPVDTVMGAVQPPSKGFGRVLLEGAGNVLRSKVSPTPLTESAKSLGQGARQAVTGFGEGLKRSLGKFQAKT